MQRRAFMKTSALLINAAIACLLAIPGMRFLLAPLQRKSKVKKYIRVASLNALSSDQPVRVQVNADRTDAFMHFPPGPIGSVWLQRVDSDDSEPKVKCFQTICPHLGCGVDYSPDRSAYFCPCHASEFDRSGAQSFGPSPRDMDELEVRITDADAEGQRWIEIKYQAFLTGTATKTPIDS